MWGKQGRVYAGWVTHKAGVTKGSQIGTNGGLRQVVSSQLSHKKGNCLLCHGGSWELHCLCELPESVETRLVDFAGGRGETLLQKLLSISAYCAEVQLGLG